MRRLLLAAVVGLLVLSSLMLSATYVAAEGTIVSGEFPNRIFDITRSGPGGPRTDTFTIDFVATRSGNWSVMAESIAGASVIVNVYDVVGGVAQLASSSKLRYAGDVSTPTPMGATLEYMVSFTPYGKAGTSRLLEQYTQPSVPTACFTFTPANPTTQDIVSFDASCSFDPDGDIVSYAWDFGDGTTGSGPMVDHSFTRARTYAVILNVTDSTGLFSVSQQPVFVAAVGLSVAWNYHDFFNVPYGEWWDMRTFFYADTPIGAECFSAEGIANGYCLPMDMAKPDVATFPYTNWYKAPTGDNAIYAPYRFDVQVQNSPAYTSAQPVLVPTCEALKAALAPDGIVIACPAAASPGSIEIQENMQYLTSLRAAQLLSQGCPDLASGNDGYLLEVDLTLRVDALAAQNLFGVTDPAQWSDTSPGALLKPGCGPGDVLDPASGALEKGLKLWLEAQGNGPYDVSNALGNPYAIYAIDATGSYDMATGQHVLKVMFAGWGHEVLSARWFYWGATPYTSGLAGVAPEGWSGMEAPWFEGLQLTGTIGTQFDATVSGVIQNHFRHAADPGPNGIYDIFDDVAKWVWAPVLADRYYPSAFRPNSELGPYLGYAYTHTTVGTLMYGIAGDYDVPPAVWALKEGESQTFHFPTDMVVLYDPKSPLLSDPWTLMPIVTSLTLGYSVPGGLGSFDPATKILSVSGPMTIPTPPLTAAGKPLESRPLYNLVAG